MKWEEGEKLPMWVADMDFAACPAVKAALENRVAHGVFGYSIIPNEWYSSIINWWKTRHGFEIKPEWLQFVTGVVPAISCLVQRLTNAGDNVALMTPVYDIFFHSVENFGRHVLECPLNFSAGKYTLDFKKLEEVLKNPLTTLLILCNPHNPTGTVWSKAELQKIGELCKAHGVTVISDEIHCDLTLPQVSYTPFASVSEVCREISITTISASKAFNLAGLQSAAVVVPNEKLFNIVSRGLNSCEVAEPNCFAVAGTVAAFNEGGIWLDELKNYLAENRRYAAKFIEEKLPKLTLVDGKATYLLWIDCSAYTKNSALLCEYLKERESLILSAGSVYRGNGASFLRMNVACPRARLKEGLERLLRGLENYSE